MTRDAFAYFTAYYAVLSTLLNVLLGAALLFVTWLSPHVDKSWLPKRLRTPPMWGGRPL